MSLPAPDYIAIHRSPGQVRAALIASDGRAWRVFQQNWDGAGDRARYKDVYSARLRQFAETQGGAFIELETGEEAFVRLKDRSGYTEGMAITVEVVSEHRRDKLARVRISDQKPHIPDAFQTWRGTIPAASELPVREAAEAVEFAFDEASQAQLTLPKGGRLFIERTRALTAFDIDTAGRVGKGSSGARALAVNREAVLEMVRQISLRELGGAFILDCVEPLNRAAGETLRAAALETFSTVNTRTYHALLPSRFGLLEANADWVFSPIEDLALANPAETALLAHLRQLQRAVESAPARLFTLSLCDQTHQAYLERQDAVNAALRAHFGGRVTLERSDENKDEIRFR